MSRRVPAEPADRPDIDRVRVLLSLLLTAFVGINQWLYVIVGACPASVVLRRVCGLRSAIYASREPATSHRPGVTV